MIDVSAGSRYYYFCDGLGSVVALLHNSAVVEMYFYDAFGRTLIYKLDTQDWDSRSSFFGNPFMFTGREYDAESRLYYYRARMYHAGLGRFLQTDPIGYADSMNLYAYCLNNPVNWIDPWGLSKEWPWFNKWYGTAFDCSIVGTYFHFWYDRGANMRDFGIWLGTGMGRARQIGQSREQQINNIVEGNSDTSREAIAGEFRDFAKDTAETTLNTPGTLTGRPLAVPYPISDVGKIIPKVISEAMEAGQKETCSPEE